MMIYDGSDVVIGVEIDPKALCALAKAFHEAEEPRGHNDWPRGCDTKEKQDQYSEQVEREVEENCGYCNDCKRIAAFVLSKFNITERD